MAGVSRSYPGVQALKGVDFDLLAGEVHSLVGENGAGKSTLMKILAGSEQPDEGRIAIGGAEHASLTPQLAHDLGVSMVYQEPDLVLDLSVRDNIVLGREPRGRLPGSTTDGRPSGLQCDALGAGGRPDLAAREGAQSQSRRAPARPDRQGHLGERAGAHPRRARRRPQRLRAGAICSSCCARWLAADTGSCTSRTASMRSSRSPTASPSSATARSSRRASAAR